MPPKSPRLKTTTDTFPIKSVETPLTYLLKALPFPLNSLSSFPNIHSNLSQHIY